jgi:DNA-binding CsgD family transcriptional regulator
VVVKVRARLNARDERAVEGLAASLAVLEEATAPALASLVIELRALLGAERVLAYGIGLQPDGFTFDFTHYSGFQIPRNEIDRLLAEAVRRTGDRPWALYDPRQPDPAQRNVALNMPPPSSLASARGNALFRKLSVAGRERRRLAARMERLNQLVLSRIGLYDLDACRVLVCDGPQILAWVGAFQSEPFSERDRAILARLTPVLARRLRTERHLASARFHSSALPIVLEAIPAEAFVLDAAGGIAHANAAGRVAGGDELRALRQRLVDEVRHRKGGEFDLTPIVVPGSPLHYLAIRRPRSGDITPRLRQAAARWALTRRQVEVLALLARGEATKSISTALRCVERTVEAHLTAIFARAGVDSRAALIARFWTL